jgi:hypothetical protein
MRRVLIAVLCAAATGAAAAVPVRRRPQFRHDPGYALVPYFYNLPGIGWGYGVLGAATKVGGSNTDVSATAFGGDADGQALGIDGIHLIPKTLILDLGAARISRSAIQSYSRRGMSTGKDDYALVEFGNFLFAGSRLTATFLERRVEAFGAYYAGSARLDALRDRSGNLILSSSNEPTRTFDMSIVGACLDLTDDYQDPRRGVRLEPSLWRSAPKGDSPDYFLTDFNATAFVPLGRRSTWAFNYLRSDAHVLRRGETDPAALERRQGLDCAALTDPDRARECRDYISVLAAQNARGTATQLGGFSRLRSYPEGRYKGAHAEFLGAELRWNLTDEVTPFDIYVMKDIRTAVQVAVFYEIGTVSDGALWATTRSSAGTGLRIVTGSGLVYRLDLAGGQEGFQPSVFFQYPWEL